LGGSIFVRQYRDRLVFESPGGLPAGITVDNILNRQYPRNRLIASIFALCGLVERSGQGMNFIYELSIKESKSIPDFGDSDDYFVTLTLNGMILDNRIFTIFDRIGEENVKVLTIDDFLIIDALLHERKLSEFLKKKTKPLINLGVVERIGRSRYILARSFYEVVGRPSVHTQLTGLDRDANKELIRKHIEKNGEKGTPLKELYHVLPSHNRSQIQVLLREMRNNEVIRLEGVTSSARWYLT
jgi:ATP-dependent DNA helicase RecG